MAKAPTHIPLTEVECLRLENLLLKKQLLDQQVQALQTQQQGIENAIRSRIGTESPIEVDLSQRIARIRQPKDNTKAATKS